MALQSKFASSLMTVYDTKLMLISSVYHPIHLQNLHFKVESAHRKKAGRMHHLTILHTYHHEHHTK